MAVLAIGAGCTEEKAPDFEPLNVGAAPAAAIDYAEEYKLTGELVARTSVGLSFRTPGKVTERLADVGTRVQPGMVLARLDATQQRAGVEAALAAVAAAEAALKQSASNLERQTSLLAQGFSTRREFDAANQAQESAKASVEGARAQLALARDQLSQTELRAPSAGVITASNFEVGQVVGAAQQLFSFAEDGPRDAVVDIQEGLIERVLRTDIAVVLVSDPSIASKGDIREVSPITDATNATVRVKIGLPETPEKMVLGSAVSVNLRTAASPRLVVRSSALFSASGKPAVWIVDPSTARVTLRPIDVESYETASVVIRGGLDAGDLVVTAGASMLHANQRVNVVGGVKP